MQKKKDEELATLIMLKAELESIPLDEVHPFDKRTIETGILILNDRLEKNDPRLGKNHCRVIEMAYEAYNNYYDRLIDIEGV